MINGKKQGVEQWQKKQTKMEASYSFLFYNYDFVANS